MNEPIMEIPKGNDKSWYFSIKKKNTKQPIDLTGAELYFSVRKENNDTSELLVYKRNSEAGGSDEEIKIINAENGKFEVFISRDDTLELDTEEYYFDCKMVKTNHITLGKGIFNITPVQTL